MNPTAAILCAGATFLAFFLCWELVHVKNNVESQAGGAVSTIVAMSR